MRCIRDRFDADGFVEVETPQLVRSPGLEVHIEALRVEGAGERRYLHPSPEYHMKRLLAAGLPRIYQLCKCFRRGELGSLHQPEFTMLEWYRTDAGSAEMMADTERLVADAAAAIHGSTRIPGIDGEVDVTPPWPRLTVAQAFARHASIPLAEALADEERFFLALVDEIEPHLGRGRPVFLTAYPAQMASLARLDPEHPSVADRFEAYVDGVELCNGFGELVDAAEQRRRLQAERATRRERGLPDHPIDERFLAALEEGVPPSGGNALGVDRLLMLLLGERDIARVVAFADERV